MVSIAMEGNPKMTRGFGFTRERPLTDLEESLGIEFDDNQAVPDLRAFQDSIFVEVSANGRSYGGIYRGTTANGTHVMFPSIIPVEPEKKLYEWVATPNFLSSKIDGFRPLIRGYAEKLAERFDKVSSLGKFWGESDSS